MKRQFSDDSNTLEIGVDEVGRGPLFGRVYAAAVILPREREHETEGTKHETEGTKHETKGFDHSQMKDSKKFSSKRKINEAAQHIREHAVAWAVAFRDETVIDQCNILQATQMAMHDAIQQVIAQIERKEKEEAKDEEKEDDKSKLLLLVDGNYFIPFASIPHYTVIGGDNEYTCIAAASILAKVARDQYIEELCQAHPELNEKYHLLSNKGYGSRAHLDGIKQHGISPWHRTTFGICKQQIQTQQQEQQEQPSCETETTHTDTSLSSS